MHSPNRQPDPVEHITSRFAHVAIPTGEGPIFIKATCLNCGTAFTVELSWLLDKEQAHAKRCNVVPIRAA